MSRKYNQTEKFLMNMRKNKNLKNIIPTITDFKKMSRSEKVQWSSKAREWSYINKHYGNSGQGKARRGAVINKIFDMKENQKGYKGMWSSKMSEYGQGYQTQYYNKKSKKFAREHIKKKSDRDKFKEYYYKSIGKGINNSQDAGNALLYQSLTEKGANNKPVNLNSLSRNAISNIFYGTEKYPKVVEYSKAPGGIVYVLQDGRVLTKYEYEKLTLTEQIQHSGGFNE